MTTYPLPSDPVSALSRPNSTSVAHSDDHGRIIGLHDNVMHYGAYGNADVDAKTGHDDAAAFTAAIAAQSVDNQFWLTGTNPNTIFIPPGRYRISSTITLDRPVRLVGAGMNSTIIVNDVPTGQPLFKIASSRSEISHLATATFGGVAGDTDKGVTISIPGDSGHIYANNHIHHVMFRWSMNPAVYEIDTTWAEETKIDHCVFAAGPAGGCIRLGDTSNASSITNCTMSAANQALWAMYLNAAGLFVADNVIEAGHGLGAIYVNANNVTLLRNWMEDNDGASIDIESSSDVTLIGNNVSADAVNGTWSLDINDSKYIFVAQNQISGSASGTVRLRSTAVVNHQTVVTFASNQFTGTVGGRIDTSGLLNASDAVVRLGERRDDVNGTAVEVVTGNVRYGSATSLAWAPTVDAAADTSLSRSAANVLALGSDDAIKTGAAVHASLPSPGSYAAGAQFYCTTDKKPVWSDGSAHWVDAAAANHT